MGECLGERYLIVKIPHKAVDAAAVREAFGLSLRKLGRSKCDLLLLHWPAESMTKGSLHEVPAGLPPAPPLAPGSGAPCLGAT